VLMRRIMLIALGIIIIPSLGFARGNQSSMPAGMSDGLTQMGSAEGILSNIERAIGNLNELTTRFRLEDKLVQADLFSEEGKYEKAALLYRDCIYDTSMRGRRDYYPTLYKLSYSLFKQGNFLSTLNFYRMLINPEAGKYYFKGLAGALNSAIKLKQAQTVSDLAEIAERLVSATPNDELSYALGKYDYHTGNYQASDRAMSRIGPTSAYYRRAAYYRASLAVRAKNFKQAITLFNAVVSGRPPATDADKAAIAQAYLGKARVLSHIGKLDQALEAYDKVPASSREYLQALYEIAWVYLGKNKPKAAVNILDILLLNLPEGNLALSARALKGRVLARLDDHVGASDAYHEVTRILAPVTRELDILSASPMKLKAYFNWIMSSGSQHFNLDMPIGEVTRKWLSFDPDLMAIQKIFFSLATQQKESGIVKKGLNDMKIVLQKPSKIDIFPRLRDNYYKVMEIKNRVLLGFSEAVGAAADRVQPYLSARDRDRLLQLERERTEGYKAMSKMPVTAKQYKGRHKQMNKKLMQVEQQVFELETALRILKKQLIGIEGLARRKEAQEKEGQTGRITDSIDIEVEKNRLKALYQQVENTRSEVEREMASSGESLLGMKKDTGMRHDLLGVITMENALIVSRLDSVPPEMAAMLAPMKTMTRRADSVFSRADRLVSQLQTMGQSTTRRLMGDLKDQLVRINQEMTSIDEARADAKSFAKKEGRSVFLSVKKRFTALLFEAELGRVEMAWRRKADLAAKLDKLGKDRTEKMHTLTKARELLSSLKKELKDFEPPKKKGNGNSVDK